MNAIAEILSGLTTAALYVMLVGLAAGVIIGCMTALAGGSVRIVEAIRSLFRTKIK